MSKQQKIEKKFKIKKIQEKIIDDKLRDAESLLAGEGKKEDAIREVESYVKLIEGKIKSVETIDNK